MPKPLTLWITTNYGKFLKTWEYQTILPTSRQTCMQLKQQQNRIWNNGLVPNWERSRSRLYIVTLSVSLTCRVHHAKCWAGWSTSWNQDCQEKYQLPDTQMTSDTQMIPPYGRKQRGLKSVVMKVKGEWKSWLKSQHSKNKDHGIQSHHFMANRCGNNRNNDRLFSWAPKSLQMVTAAMKLKDACSLEEKLWPT